MKEKGIVKETTINEDYKTALAHNQRLLEAGEEVVILEIMKNLCGSFYYVEAADGETFYVNENNLKRVADNEQT